MDICLLSTSSSSISDISSASTRRETSNSSLSCSSLTSLDSEEPISSVDCCADISQSSQAGLDQAVEKPSYLDSDVTPRLPGPHISSDDIADDAGYQSEREDDGRHPAANGTPGRSKRSRAETRRLWAEYRRCRDITPPVVPLAKLIPSADVGDSEYGLEQRAPTDLDTVPSSAQSKVCKPKGPLGLGLGFPRKHPLGTPRAHTASEISLQQTASVMSLMCTKPLGISLPALKDVHEPHICPTVLAESPSPMEQLPPRRLCGKPRFRRLGSQTSHASRELAASSISKSDICSEKRSTAILFPAVDDVTDRAYVLMADHANAHRGGSTTLSFSRLPLIADPPSKPHIRQPTISYNPYFEAATVHL